MSKWFPRAPEGRVAPGRGAPVPGRARATQVTRSRRAGRADSSDWQASSAGQPGELAGERLPPDQPGPAARPAWLRSRRPCPGRRRGSASRDTGPATSGTDDRFEATTGAPHRRASRTGSPSPSYSDGHRNTRHVWYSPQLGVGDGPGEPEGVTDPEVPAQPGEPGVVVRPQPPGDDQVEGRPERAREGGERAERRPSSCVPPARWRRTGRTPGRGPVGPPAASAGRPTRPPVGGRSTGPGPRRWSSPPRPGRGTAGAGRGSTPPRWRAPVRVQQPPNLPPVPGLGLGPPE